MREVKLSFRTETMRISLSNRNLSFSCLNETNECFNIIKVIVISNNSLTMIDNTILFIFFKTVQKGFNSIPFGKHRESIGFDFCEHTFSTVGFT